MIGIKTLNYSVLIVVDGLGSMEECKREVAATCTITPNLGREEVIDEIQTHL